MDAPILDDDLQPINPMIAAALAHGEDATGLCTVREAVASMLKYNPPHNPMELYFEMNGVRYNVEIKIIAVDGKVERRCPDCGSIMMPTSFNLRLIAVIKQDFEAAEALIKASQDHQEQGE